MAAVVTNRGLQWLSTEDISQATYLSVATFLGTVPDASTIRDWNFLSDVTTTESSNVARQTQLTPTVTENDDPTNTVTWFLSGPTVASVSAGETLTHVAWYVYDASDAAAVLIAVDEPAATVATDGTDVTLPDFDATIRQA